MIADLNILILTSSIASIFYNIYKYIKVFIYSNKGMVLWSVFSFKWVHLDFKAL